MGNRVNFLIVGDDAYLRKGFGFAVSLYEMHKHVNVCIYAMSTVISKETRDSYKKIAEKYNQQFEAIVIPEDDEDVIAFGSIAVGRWNVNAYLYMLAGRYLPSTVHQAVYLDLDITLYKPIGELIPLANNEKIFSYFRLSDSVAPDNYDELMARKGQYGSSGQLVINLDNLRKWYESYSLASIINSNRDLELFDDSGLNDLLFWADQGLLNFAFFEYSDFNCFPSQMRWSPEEVISDEVYGFHVMFDKPETISYYKFLGHNQTIYGPYLMNRIKSDFILSDSRYIEELVEDINLVTRGKKVQMVGVSRPIVSYGSGWRLGEIDYKYIKAINRDQKFLKVPLLEEMNANQSYRISVLCKLVGTKYQPRLIGMKNKKFFLPELGKFDEISEGMYELNVIVQGNPSLTAFAYSSSDFEKGGAIEILEFSVRPID
jgi:lipopolysaccharide biosynthesis glycosyltransferase